MTTGIILHSIDYDELASLVGKKLDVTQPANVKVIEYNGPKETRDFYDKRRIGVLAEEERSAFVAMFAKDYKTWMAKTIKQNNADYLLRLHSTKTRYEFKDNIEMHIFPSCFNTELKEALFNFCENDSSKKFLHSANVMPAKEALVEILHSPKELNFDLASCWMVELASFLNNNYSPKKPSH